MGIFDTTGLLGTWRANVLRDNSEFTGRAAGCPQSRLPERHMPVAGMSMNHVFTHNRAHNPRITFGASMPSAPFTKKGEKINKIGDLCGL